MVNYTHILLKVLRIICPLTYLINGFVMGCLYRGGGGLAYVFNVWNPPTVEKKQKGLND